MLEKVEAVNSSGEVLELPIANSPGGYIVEDIDGLDPTKAIFASTILATMDGEEYQASRGEKRQITIKLGYSLTHLDSVRIRRLNLYKWFMPQTEVLLRFFMTDFPIVQIMARTEDLDAPMFAKDPKATIIAVAHKPDFIGENPVIVEGATTTGPDTIDIPYEGSVESGFLWTMTSNRTLGNFTLNINQPNGLGGELSFTGNLLAGDMVEINTQTGERGAWRTRDDERTSILNSVSDGFDSMQLLPGSNSFQVYAPGSAIDYQLEYKERFGGL